MTKLQKSYQSLTSKAMKAEMLEPDVELDLARRWHRDGCETSLHRLVNAYMRLAVSMASKLRNLIQREVYDFQPMLLGGLKHLYKTLCSEIGPW